VEREEGREGRGGREEGWGGGEGSKEEEGKERINNKK